MFKGIKKPQRIEIVINLFFVKVTLVWETP